MKNKGTVLFSFMPVVLLASFLRTAPLKIATVNAGDLIKGSYSAVYYLGSDNKRYVFPNDKVYFSWYADFSGVKTVSDSALANYPLGGNITYRPGMHLVKIQSDPKVYAVGLGGVLHWVSTASVASGIFGSDWSKKVDDIADAFFINYTVGTPIYSTGDYNPSSLASSDYNINIDKRLSSSGNSNTNSSTNPASVSVSLSPYSSALTSGQYTTATAIAFDPDGLTGMRIYVNGNLIQACPITGNQTNGICTLNIYANNYQNSGTINIYAQGIDRFSNTTDSSVVTLTTQSSSGTNNASVSVSLSPYANTLVTGQTTTVTVTAYDPDGLTSVAIFVNGSLAQTCQVSGYQANGSCAVDLYGANYSNGANISIYGQATDRYSSVATSSTSTLNAQGGNSAASGSVSVALSPYANTLGSGQYTTATASAYDTDGLTSVAIYVNGSLLQNCPVTSYPASSTCAANIFANSYANGATVGIYAQETDRYGHTASSPTSTLTIQANGSANSGSVSVSLSPYAITLGAGQFTTVSTVANDSSGLTSIAIYVNGSLSQTCPISGYPASGSCTLNVYGNNYANGSTLSIYAQAVNRYGAVSNSSTATLTVQSSTGAVNSGSADVSVSLSPYSATLAPGQFTTVSAISSDPSGIVSVGIYVNGSLSQNCSLAGFPANGSCTLNVYGSNYAVGATLSIYAQSVSRYGSVSNSPTRTVTIQNQTVTNASGSYVTLAFSPDSTTLQAGASNTVTANAYDANGLTSIGVYVNGSLAQTCSLSGFPANGSCAVVLYGSNYASGSTISVSAQAVDRNSNIVIAPTKSLSR